MAVVITNTTHNPIMHISFVEVLGFHLEVITPWGHAALSSEESTVHIYSIPDPLL